MSTASNKGAPMNDVELDNLFNLLKTSVTCRSGTGHHDIVIDHTEAKTAIQALFTQEKANLKAALEAELPKKIDPLDVGALTGPDKTASPKILTQAQGAYMMAWNSNVAEVREAIAAVFNKGDSNGLN